jgi:hypothetical protein
VPLIGLPSIHTHIVPLIGLPSLHTHIVPLIGLRSLHARIVPLIGLRSLHTDIVPLIGPQQIKGLGLLRHSSVCLFELASRGSRALLKWPDSLPCPHHIKTRRREVTKIINGLLKVTISGLFSLTFYLVHILSSSLKINGIIPSCVCVRSRQGPVTRSAKRCGLFEIANQTEATKAETYVCSGCGPKGRNKYVGTKVLSIQLCATRTQSLIVLYVLMSNYSFYVAIKFLTSFLMTQSRLAGNPRSSP